MNKTLENILINSYEASNLKKWEERISQEVNEYSYFVDMQKVHGTCVDVGANIGAFSFKYGNLFNRVICIEPAAGNVKFIKNSIIEKNIKNIEVIRRAVSVNNKDVVKLRPMKTLNGFDGIGSIGDLSTQLHTFLDQTGWLDESDNYEEVETINLENIFLDFNLKTINLLKVDCEGSEYDFLFDKDLKYIDRIVMEVHGFLSQEKIAKLINHINKTHNVFRITKPTPNFNIGFVSKLNNS